MFSPSPWCYVSLMDKDLQEVREIFDHFDKDGNGTIDPNEFADLLDALGSGFSDQEVQLGLEAIDLNKNGRIEFNEFLKWWNER